MPFEIEPLGEVARAPRASYSPDWDWVVKQPYSKDYAWSNIGNYRPGSLGGGPTAAQFELLDNPRKYAVFAPAPAITDRAQTQQQAFGRFGSVTLSEIDPFLTVQSIAEGVGFTSDQASDIARAPQTFLGERDIDPFGQGSSGVPSRLADYATGWLSALYDQATGKPIVAPLPQGADALQYNFQRDPAYWALVGAPGASDDFLRGVAVQLAGQYVSGDNAYLVEKLTEQFKIDRDRALGISSGDRRLDYQAKLAFTVDYIQNATYQPPPPVIGRRAPPKAAPPPRDALGRVYTAEAGTAALMQLPSAVAGALPFVGADIREAAYRHPQQIEDAWAKLTNEQRQGYFSKAGFHMLLGDAVVWLPLLSGAGAVEAVATRTGGVAFKAFKAYEYTRNVTVAVMATGLSVATANWLAEAAVPGYAEGFGKRLDYARPVSSSAIAGLFNQMGFFASGTFGGYTAARVAGRVVGKVSRVGAAELSYFRNVFGGSAIARELGDVGLPEAGLLRLSPQRSFLSYLLNWRRAEREAIYDAYVKGNPTFTKLDEIADQAARVDAANAALLRGLDQAGSEAEGIAKAMMEARRPRPLFAGQAQRVHDMAVKLARFVDDEMARLHAEEFGPTWVARTAGEYSAPAMERYVRAQVARLGGDAAKLGRHNEEGWAQVMRYLHNFEYDRNNGLLQAVAADTDEASRLLLMQADHLFAADADRIVAQLRGDDVVLAQAIAADTIRSKREAAAWFASEWEPKSGALKVPERVPPAELADWIDDVRAALPHRRGLPDPASTTAGMPLNAFHAELEKNGLWTLGFKPTDEAGNAISYVRRRNGVVFKSPWIEYPVGSNEAIELGNRGLLASKIDGVTRGFRTWKIIEYQKGLLYRRLSTRLDVSAEQIGRFHAGVMRLAQASGSQPQTLGAVARARSPLPFAPLVREKIDQLVDDVFGPGPHFSKTTGKPIDFADEIAKSYRQSFRLNLTAGLTSYLKANLGEVGSAIAWLSDSAYVTWRFNLSPIFKGGELLESFQFNAMRGVRDVGPDVQALYYRAGLGNDYGPLAAEMSYDDMIRAMSEKRAIGPTDASGRFAASEAFYARRIPEDFELRARTAFEQQAAADFRAMHGNGGQLPSADFVPVRTGRVVGPDELPADFSPSLRDHAPEFSSPDVMPEDEVLLHATTSLDGVYRDGLKAAKDVENIGLGTGGTGSFQISTTWDRAFADTIADRLRLLARSARGEASVDDILDHFAQYYGDDAWGLADALGIYDAAYKQMGWDDLARILPDKKAWKRGEFIDMATPEGKFEAVQRLDNKLWPGDEQGFHGWVGLQGSFEDALRINPDDVGVVQVAARKDSAGVKSGPDYAEIRFNPEDIVVIDDRPVLSPLADDEVGLLRQLRATLATEPKPGQLSIADYMIGGNGIAPGLEGRARQILTKLEDLQAKRLDDGPVFTWDAATADQQAVFRARLEADGWVQPEGWNYRLVGDDIRRQRLDGSNEEASIARLYEEYQRQPGTASSLEEVAGTPEAFFDVASREGQSTGWQARWEMFVHPTAYKLGKATQLQIKIARDEFPSLLRLSGNDGLIQVFNDLGISENRWLDWLIEDRNRLAKWLDTGDQADFDALLGHVGKDADRAAFNEFYASDEWAALSGLLAANFRTAGQEAFSVHFFSTYRSPLERSLNHPLLGLYPASWSLKAAREWARFLFNNRTLGINIGMAPAQAIAQIVHAQHASFAMSNEQELDTFLQDGPLGSPLFIFNLLMPGDWSALPFSASRTIRDYARPILANGTLPDAGEVFANNVRTIGLTRDARLFFESLGQFGDLLLDPGDEPDPIRRLRRYSVKGDWLTYEGIGAGY